jgi:type IV pilus assembly protein PilA
MYANALYFRVVRNRIAKAQGYAADRERQLRALAGEGGTSPVALIIALVIGVGIVPVIGILAAIAIPAYQDYTIRAQVSEGLNLASQAKTGVAETYALTDSFPGSNTDARVAAAERLAGNYTSGVTVLTGGQIRITYGNLAHVNIAGDTLFLTPFVDAAGGIAWQCGNFDLRDTVLDRSAGAASPLNGGTLEQQYRPSNCRG